MYDLRKVVAIFPGAGAGQSFFDEADPEIDDWKDYEPETIQEEGVAEPDMTALALPMDISPYERLNPKSINGTDWVLLSEVEGAISLQAKEISRLFSACIDSAYQLHSMMAFAFSMSFSTTNLDPAFEHRCTNFHVCFKGKCKCRSYVTYIPHIVAKRIIDQHLKEAFEQEPANDQIEVCNNIIEPAALFSQTARVNLSRLLASHNLKS